MTISLNAYLNFAGNTREAMTFYQDVFGGDLTIQTFADFGMTDMPSDGTMHARLVNETFTLMATDAMPGAEKTWGGTRTYLCLTGDDLKVMTGWYHRLATDGTPGQPLAKQVWGDTYGDVKDAFGIEWMFNIAEPAES